MIYYSIYWNYPTPSDSHHQDYSIFDRESRPKPSFVTGILGAKPLNSAECLLVVLKVLPRSFSRDGKGDVWVFLKILWKDSKSFLMEILISNKLCILLHLGPYRFQCLVKTTICRWLCALNTNDGIGNADVQRRAGGRNGGWAARGVMAKVDFDDFSSWSCFFGDSGL